MLIGRYLERSAATRSIETVRCHLQEVAQSEMARHRRRLGPLTPAQESAVEVLLASTIDQILGQLAEHIQNYPEDVQLKFTSAWSLQT